MSYKPGLYIVSTPIGNFKDITLRALEILQCSSYILCEDTRKSKKLLAEYNISKKMILYNDYSTLKTREYIKHLITNKKVVSIISDAGTPLISDPGYKLVKFLQENDCYVNIIPGACSVIAALAISGMPTDKFIFLGFLPKTTTAKEKLLKTLYNSNLTIIMLETAKRLLSSLSSILKILGDIEICVARELTKIHQEVKRMKANAMIQYYQNNIAKGEIVLLISPQSITKSDIEQVTCSIEDRIFELINQNSTTKDIVNLIYDTSNKLYNKSDLYKMVTKIKDNLQ
ncbi:16S rRNA (cytidine(1402)-2'-O)-methyltransferase [Orientia tsutsugamushi]|uniref:Ribosomal RNA small subunit methyltransferase I n=1 Tax=Orientia tsutsugamushi TaxID=784 RepID=A0A2U3RSB7_ORITS|nr:16S rRNA (cytidine(1402)-2'-O)-methyltransferase [Orientia tsutsugamushi]KJV54945.1 tetrapyrrole (Corrin/Porphyrin) Methylases family protein [Orientia tsutsugamushi str. Karp]SPR15968.1 rRNA (cytidine-2'-O-)-methyltransferase [Orientia tsutsugamushi]